jgi:hypothetical protein
LIVPLGVSQEMFEIEFKIDLPCQPGDAVTLEKVKPAKR